MRIIKKLILTTTIIGAVLFSILVVFGFLYQDSIINSVKSEINKHLNAEIKVGKIELSFISNFPLASVSLHNVVGYEAKTYTQKPDTLFVVEQLDMSFNVMEILEGRYMLNELEAKNGKLNLEINKNGIENYLIFYSETQDTSSFSLNLEKVVLVNINAGFNDFRDSDSYRIQFINAVAKGKFSDTEVHTALYGNVIVRDLTLENSEYLINEKARVDIGIGINLERNTFQISRGYLTLRDNYKFEVKGKTIPNNFSYSFDAVGLNVHEAKTLLPEKHVKVLKDYKLDGSLNVHLDVSRDEDEKHPRIKGEFDLNAGSLEYLITGEKVTLNSIDGSFDLGKNASLSTLEIRIPSFSLVTKEANATGSFEVRNLNSPKYRIQTKGRADLFELSKLADLGDDFGMQGFADFEISAKGSFMKNDTITDEDIKRISGVAQINLTEGIFRIKGLPTLEKVHTKINVNERDVQFTSFSAQVAHSQTTGQAQLHNWLSYVLKKSERLDITGDVATEMFDLNDWVSDKENTSNSTGLPEYLSFVGEIKVGVLKARKTILENVTSSVNFFPKRLKLSNTYFDAFGGRVFTNSTLSQWANGHEFKGDVKTMDIDLHNVLKTYENFGITSFNYKQIQGKLHSSFAYQFSTNNQFEIDQPSIFVDGDLMLLNGEIIENKLLYNIPKEVESNKVIALFVNLDLFEKRLHHIKFDTITNHITIQNEEVKIPQMMIKSTALNIGVQGSHYFNNEMDYYMNFNLNNVLGKKEPITDEYGFIEDDKDGNRNMYLHVFTKNGEFVVDVDKYGAKKLINLEGNQQVETTKSILKEEFGLFKNDTSVTALEKEETFEYDVDLGEFSDTVKSDSAIQLPKDTLKSDSSVIGKLLKKKKKKKKEDNFEEWDVEDDDY